MTPAPTCGRSERIKISLLAELEGKHLSLATRHTIGDERVFLCLGSNLDDRLGYLRAAARALRNESEITIVGASNVYESAAMYMDEKTPPFLNAAVEIRTSLEPENLLRVLQRIESGLGRLHGPRARYESRLIDIDIALWGDRRISSSRLTIPHPGLRYRRFFLQPLVDLDPNLRLPDTDQTVYERAAQLARRQHLTRFATVEEWADLEC